ncbi:MAG: arsenate reductase family protein [Sphingomonadaceae bacterium]|uniref:arsenate reductase family protein n=1 Tax=Thermaurantiacus sp. TaxID=2820283 RepID=UPI00298F2D80|nr:arsenate reductase family protein [Thermaurantiacus sp.]MCS6986453.1 arsenate reductase family protein [Sphingomonadaceae bacterium]MDW8414286.1 arsenate reductase family protein [Thermaurantiacus sp.]
MTRPASKATPRLVIVVYHNPACGTSRNVLAIVRASGEEPVVVEYLQEGWTRAQLLGLFAAAGLTPRQALRANVPEAQGLDDADDETLLAAMVRHPILVNRPIVCSPRGVRLCRPSEAVLPLLDRPPPPEFRKEDGSPLSA